MAVSTVLGGTVVLAMVTPPAPVAKPNMHQKQGALQSLIQNVVGQNNNISTNSDEKTVLRPLKKPIETDMSKRLSDADAARYAHVFAFQEAGKWDQADREIEKLKDYRLMGHVLHQRYMHPTAYRATYEELSNWLRLYGDHPGAPRVYKLTKKRRPSEKLSIPRTNVGYGTVGRLDLDAGKAAIRYVSDRKRSRAQRNRMRDLRRFIRKDLSRGAPTRAYGRLQTVESKQLFDTVEYDAIKADIASSYFYAGKPDKAYELAQQSVIRSKTDVPVAGWIAGLVAWTKGEYIQSAQYFEYVANSDRASAWTVSAGAYWASRAHLRAKDPRKSSQYLKQAARHPYSFYGLIAARALGKRAEKYEWKSPRLTEKHFTRLAQNSAGHRALALLDAGQSRLAELELRQVNARKDSVLQEALLGLAENAGLPSLAMRIGSAVTKTNGKLYDAALYPVSPWRPDEGFEVDRALVYAFIRQESRFDPYVSNRSGATGLMQLMPTTASYVAGVKSRYFKGREGQRKLLDPVLNIDLGQKYLKNLLGNSSIDNDLFKLAIAYNAGPGNLAKWKRKMGSIVDNDPLLFIEMVPAAETRAFVERVVSNYWIYRSRFKQKNPSLKAAAAGKSPIYFGQDSDKLRMASGMTIRRWQ